MRVLRAHSFWLDVVAVDVDGFRRQKRVKITLAHNPPFLAKANDIYEVEA